MLGKGQIRQRQGAYIIWAGTYAGGAMLAVADNSPALSGKVCVEMTEEEAREPRSPKSPASPPPGGDRGGPAADASNVAPPPGPPPPPPEAVAKAAGAVPSRGAGPWAPPEPAAPWREARRLSWAGSAPAGRSVLSTLPAAAGQGVFVSAVGGGLDVSGGWGTAGQGQGQGQGRGQGSTCPSWRATSTGGRPSPPASRPSPPRRQKPTLARTRCGSTRPARPLKP